jgi:hypothetical protein
MAASSVSGKLMPRVLAVLRRRSESLNQDDPDDPKDSLTALQNFGKDLNRLWVILDAFSESHRVLRFPECAKSDQS